MKIAIIGAGLTGLTASYYLSKNRHQITVYEKESIAGGLARGFKEKNWLWSLENYYHHIFSNDRGVIGLTKDLGTFNKIIFSRPVTSTFLRNSIKQLDDPFSLLLFPYLSLPDRLRAGLLILYLKLINNSKLEGITASKFLEKKLGHKSFKLLWKPLLVGKFGIYADQISASWFWARIKKRTKKLGYYQGGFQELINDLVKSSIKNGVKFLFNCEIKEISKIDSKFKIFDEIYDKVIINIPTPNFIKIASFLPDNYKSQLNRIVHLSSLSLILVTDKPILDKTYWLNINETGFPFLSLVQHTNFIDKKYYGNQYITYIGNYLPVNHPYLKKSKEELLKIFLPHIKKISPNLKFIIHDSFLFNDDFSQTVITTDYSTIKPTFETPINNLYLGNIDVVYPWDRGINYAIELGKKIAIQINNNE